MHDQGLSVSRRELLRVGLGGFSALSLPEVLRIRNAQAAQTASKSAGRTAIILVWLRGGASHLDTFDPKPMASSDYRGPFAPISTNVPGIEITELLPRLSKVADKYALVRSLTHTGG